MSFLRCSFVVLSSALLLTGAQPDALVKDDTYVKDDAELKYNRRVAAADVDTGAVLRGLYAAKKQGKGV
jgi:hypothetical protein